MTLSLSPELIRFLTQNQNQDPRELVLAGRDICGYPTAFVADQLRARQLQTKRLPSWCADVNVIFPPSLNLEQSSSERTAMCKAGLVKEWSQDQSLCHLADLSAGFGVDSVAFSKVFVSLSVVEPDMRLLEMSRYNFRFLGGCPAEFYPISADEFLKSVDIKPDWLYLDPSRRRDGQRVNHLEDGDPNVLELLDQYWRRAPESDRPHILLKTAPMMDISEALRLLPETAHVVVIAVENECREVLYHLDPKGSQSTEIVCLNLLNNGNEQRFTFYGREERAAEPEYAEPRRFLFEPNSSILKAGAFRLVAARYGLCRMEESTHLLTGDMVPDDFPGRVFEVIRPIRKNEEGLRADVLVRNHPLHPNEVARHFGFTEGGSEVVVAFRSRAGKHVLLTRRWSDKQER